MACRDCRQSGSISCQIPVLIPAYNFTQSRVVNVTWNIKPKFSSEFSSVVTREYIKSRVWRNQTAASHLLRFEIWRNKVVNIKVWRDQVKPETLRGEDKRNDDIADSWEYNKQRQKKWTHQWRGDSQKYLQEQRQLQTRFTTPAIVLVTDCSHQRRVLLYVVQHHVTTLSGKRCDEITLPAPSAKY